MTFAPPRLQELAAYWTMEGGVNLGIVGDAGHMDRGVSYHLGRDDLKPDAYSIRTQRDRLGLTDAASAIDLGRLNGTLLQLQRFSRWLVQEGRHNAPGTPDIREIIYSPDGTVVLRWDRERGYASEPRGGEADDTHLTHTHVSFYRDAELRDHTTAFRPYFTEDGMFPIRITGRGGTVTVAADVELFPLDGGPANTSHPPIDQPGASADHDVDGGSAGYIFTGVSGASYWVRESDSSFASSCDSEVNAALDAVDKAVKAARP